MQRILLVLSYRVNNYFLDEDNQRYNSYLRSLLADCTDPLFKVNFYGCLVY